MTSKYLLRPTTVLLLASTLFLALLAWRLRGSEEIFSLIYKDLQIKVPYWILLLACCLVILLILNKDEAIWAIKNLEMKPNTAPKIMPKYLNSDRSYLSEGIEAYDKYYYDIALQLFGKIRSLSGPAYIRWKYYEAMCYVRMEQHKKRVLLDELDLKAIESALSRFKTIMSDYPDDTLYPDAKYWYAQSLLYFKNNREVAFKTFQELLNENANNRHYRWRESTIFYSALILRSNCDAESKKKGDDKLRDFLQKYGENLIQPVEMGRELYKVRQLPELMKRKNFH